MRTLVLKLTIMLKTLLADHCETIGWTVTNKVIDHLIHNRLLTNIYDWVWRSFVASDGCN